MKHGFVRKQNRATSCVFAVCTNLQVTLRLWHNCDLPPWYTAIGRSFKISCEDFVFSCLGYKTQNTYLVWISNKQTWKPCVTVHSRVRAAGNSQLKNIVVVETVRKWKNDLNMHQCDENCLNDRKHLLVWLTWRRWGSWLVPQPATRGKSRWLDFPLEELSCCCVSLCTSSEVWCGFSLRCPHIDLTSCIVFVL